MKTSKPPWREQFGASQPCSDAFHRNRTSNVHHEGEKIVVSAEEASGGEKRHEVRYILAISLILVVILFAIIYAVGVLSSDAPDKSGAKAVHKSAALRKV
jgi:hypothetical protein